MNVITMAFRGVCSICGGGGFVFPRIELLEHAWGVSFVCADHLPTARVEIVHKKSPLVTVIGTVADMSEGGKNGT